MNEVSKDEFYQKMNHLDIHPRPHKTDGVWYCDWKLPNGKVIGKTTIDYRGITCKYELYKNSKESSFK